MVLILALYVMLWFPPADAFLLIFIKFGGGREVGHESYFFTPHCPMYLNQRQTNHFTASFSKKEKLHPVGTELITDHHWCLSNCAELSFPVILDFETPKLML